jgi:hypothetical protein
MKNLRKGIGGAILSFAFIFGITAATSTAAQAQYRNDRDYQYQRRDRNRNDRERSREWRRRHRERNRDWDRGNARYDDRYRRNNGYGNNGRYGRYDGYGNNGGYGGYNTNQAELNRGYQQGLSTGASDGQRGQSYSPQRSRHYKNASTQAFREGFVRGYDQGYRQYAGYDNGGYRRGGTSGLGGILGEILGRP